jgi:lysophospholipase L1-like esterase
MSVNTKMTAIANEIRELSGTTSAMGLDAMASNVNNANTEINEQEELLMQITNALDGKAMTADLLNNKKFLIVGDSINFGAGWEGGYANLFAEDFPSAIVQNASVSGAKFINEEIYYQVVISFQSGFIPDYILMDGGGNDLLANAAKGEIDPELYNSSETAFDISTVAGAFEQFAANVQKYLPNTKIIFTNLYKLHPTTTGKSYAEQKELWDLLQQCCEKYSIRYVDLYREGNFTPGITEQYNAFMYDWIHINEAGYRRFWPMIKNAILTA